MRNGKCLIVWDRIGDYHRARVAALEEQLGSDNVFTADLGSADGLYGWENTKGSAKHFILSDKPVDRRDWIRRLQHFCSIIRRKQIGHLAIAGYGRPEYVLFLVAGRLMGRRITLFAESWYGNNSWANRLKGSFLRMFCQRFFLSGKRARRHFRECLGIPDTRLLEGYSAVDNDHFRPKPGVEREAILLCVARFSPEKNLSLLVRAFQRSVLCRTFRLRIIGGGSEREALEALIEKSGKVELKDWLSYEYLPEEYGRARFFILPSIFEPWGLVVNEAMAAGLPVIVSAQCGCQPDLVPRDGGNGMVFDAQDEDGLVRILDKLAEIGPDEWQAMSNHSLEIIDQFGCTQWAKKLERSFFSNARH